MKVKILTFILLLGAFACGQADVPKNPTVVKLDKFISTEKFREDDSILYPGLNDENMRMEYSRSMNEIAINLKNDYNKADTSKQILLTEIRKGLKNFSYWHTDTEERERIGLYLQELCDIVKVPAPKKAINSFILGFDPFFK